MPTEVQEVQRRSFRRNRLLALGGALGSLALIGILILAASLARLPPKLRERAIAILRDRFDSELEIGSLKVVSAFPLVRLEGEELALRHHGRTDVPPLIFIKRVSAEASLLGFLRSPSRVRNVHITELSIHVPPRGTRERYRGHQEKGEYRVLVDELVSEGARLEILRKDQDKEPLTFEIQRLVMQSLGSGQPAPFHATLINARPTGEIETKGQFGPWNREEPRSTFLSAAYTFKKARLADFDGIAGTLSSTGKFGGVLERIEADGETDTPDFTVRLSGNPVSLHTKYHAIIDGTNGDTYLQPIQAGFLHSLVIARGEVAKKPGDKERTIMLDVTVDRGRLEDTLRLAVKGNKPPMTGTVSFKTKFELPPGDEDVALRLRLDGVFGVGAAQFTGINVQEKVNTLSRKGRGEPDAEDQESVVSNLKGHFALRNGVFSFSNLVFDVPGAAVQLTGQYDLQSETLDFHGHLRMQAKLSQTTTGVKSFLLKAVDPFFHKHGAGAVVPIKVTGTRTAPSFGLDFHRRK